MGEYVKMLLSLIRLLGKKIKLGSNLSFTLKERIAISTRLVTARGSKVHFHDNVCISRLGQIFVGNKGHLVFGQGVYCNNAVFISCQNHIVLEKGCLLGPNVSLIDNSHAFSREKGVMPLSDNVGTIVVGENTWICANAVILKDTTIGKNCVIGAGCVVQGDIPDYSIVKQDKQNRIIEMK